MQVHLVSMLMFMSILTSAQASYAHDCSYMYACITVDAR